MAVWTLKHDDVTQTFEAWGLEGLRRTQASQAMGTVSFVRRSAYDAAPLFAVDDQVIIYKDGVVWHVGPVLTVPRMGAARSEAQMYTVGDPWWYLDNLVYDQSIALANDEGIIDFGQTTLVTMFAVIEDLEAGTYVKSTAQQMIGTAVALAVTAGASMQVAFEGDFDVSPPVHSLRDPTCAEIIRFVLRWLPDTAMGWDFSTVDGEGNPRPTLRISRRANATVRTLDAGDGRTLNSITVTPRDDLRRDRVVIQYEVTNTDGEYVSVAYVTDAAGTGSPFRTLKATVPLSGFNRQYQEQYLEVEPISEDNAAWWKRNLADLADVDDLAVEGGEIEPKEEGGATFHNQIKSGAVPPWMNPETVSGMMRVTARGSYTKANDEGAETTFADDALSTDVAATNMATGNYRELDSEEPGESIPSGVAAYLHAALSVTQQEGSAVVKKRECAFIARPGDVLNVTNGVAGWATMNAQIQKIDEDVDTGETVITFGPPNQLSVQDLVDMLKTFRIGLPSNSLKERATGKKGDGNEIKGSRNTANDNGSKGATHWNKVVSKGTGGGTLTLDADKGLKVQLGSMHIEISVNDEGVPSLVINDGSGNVMQIKGERILMEKSGGATMSLDADELVFSKDGKSATLSFEHLVLVGADSTSRVQPDLMKVEKGANSTVQNDEQFMVTSATGQAVIEAENAYVSNGDNEAQISAADGHKHQLGGDFASINATSGVSMSIDSKTASLSPDQLSIDQGGSSTATLAPEGGLDINSGDARVRATPAGGVVHDDADGGKGTFNSSKMEVEADGDFARGTITAGFANEVGGQIARIGATAGAYLEASSGTVTIQAVAGRTVTLQDTEMCEPGDTLVAVVLRSDAE